MERKIKIIVTDEDGVILDSITLEVSEDIRAIAYRPITTTIASRGDEEELMIGDGK